MQCYLGKSKHRRQERNAIHNVFLQYSANDIHNRPHIITTEARSGKENQREDPNGKTAPNRPRGRPDEPNHQTPKPTPKEDKVFSRLIFAFVALNYLLLITREKGQRKGRQNHPAKVDHHLHRFLLPLRSTGKDTETTEGNTP